MFYSFFSSPLPCKSVAPEVEMVERSLLAPGKGTFWQKKLIQIFKVGNFANFFENSIRYFTAGNST